MKIINKDNILSIYTHSSLEKLLSIFLNNLHHQLILSPYFVKYEPYDFQKYVVLKSIRNENIKIFLADEVGLGKTIEALLIIQELILRNDYKKILIILPKSLIKQWESEINNWTYFIHQINKNFVFESTDLITAITKDEEKKLVICSEKLLTFNNNFEKNQIDWDLIIIDEVHHARAYEYYSRQDDITRGRWNKLYRCLVTLSKNLKSVLFLSATPIQLEISEFKKLIEINNKEIFFEISFEDYQNYHTFIKIFYFLIWEYENESSEIEKLIIFKKINEYIESEENKRFWDVFNHKYKVIDYKRFKSNLFFDLNLENLKLHLKSEHLFSKILIRNRKRDIFVGLKSRNVNDCPVEMHKSYKKTYEKIDDVIKSFENQEFGDNVENIEYKATIRGYLLSNFREYMASSTAQIISSLNNRQERKLGFFGKNYKFSEEFKQINQVLIDLKLLKVENDNKLIKLREVLEDCKENTHIIIFARYYATINYVKTYIEGLHNKEIHVLTGEIAQTLKEREEIITHFNEFGGILLSTDIGGEGLNLQSANVIINYDLHWNPTRLEQRIGRIDRIGQKKRVIVYNIYYKDSVAGKIYSVLKGRLKLQTHSFGEIDPILEDISREIRKQEEELEFNTPLLDHQFKTYINKINSRINNFKEDLILKEESFDISYFDEIKKVIPKLKFYFILNYLNLLLKNHKELINNNRKSYYDSQYLYLLNFVFNINKESIEWQQIINGEKSPYWKNALNENQHVKNYIAIPRVKTLGNYYHGIGDPTLNALIYYFGEKSLKLSNIVYSKITLPNIMDGYTFFYQVEFHSGLIDHKLIIPIFFTLEGKFIKDYCSNLLYEIFKKGIISENFIDPNIDFNSINNLPYENVISEEIEDYKNLLLKEQNLIKQQRIYNIKAKADFIENKILISRNNFLTKKCNIELKINQELELSEQELKDFKYANTRVENLDLELKENHNKTKEELNKIEILEKFQYNKRLFLILKVEAPTEKEAGLFKIEDNFSDSENEKYINQIFSYNLMPLRSMTELLNNPEEITFQVEVNNIPVKSEILVDNVILGIRKVDVNTINSCKDIKINFRLENVISDILEVSLSCITETTRLQLSNNLIKVNIYKIFVEDNNQLINLSKREFFLVKVNENYHFVIKTYKNLKNLQIYTKNSYNIDELIESITFDAENDNDGSKYFKFTLKIPNYGKYFFKISGIIDKLSLLAIPPLEIELPDLGESDGYVITPLERTFINIYGEKDDFKESVLENLIFITKDSKNKTINKTILDSISYDSFKLDSNKQSDKISLSSILPEDVKNLRLGEYIIICELFGFKIKDFRFKLFPIIIIPKFENLKLLSDCEPPIIEISFDDVSHLDFNSFLDYSFPELKYKYLNHRIQEDCDYTQNVNDKNQCIVNFKPNIGNLIPGEYYSLRIKMKYEVFDGHYIPGPILNVGNLGLNNIFVYEGNSSKYLLVSNIGFNFLSFNKKNSSLHKGLNIFKIDSINDAIILLDEHLVKQEFDPKKFDKHEVVRECISNNNSFTSNINNYLAHELNFFEEKRFDRSVLFLKAHEFDISQLILKSKNYFDNIYVIYPTNHLFQEEISTILSNTKTNNNYRDVNINLMTYPSPLGKIIFNEKNEENYQKRKIFPVIFEKCHKCNKKKKYDLESKNLVCMCNSKLNYKNLSKIYEVSTKISLICPECHSRLIILLIKEKRSKFIFSCEKCQFHAENLNIFFNIFKYSQVNSINFMTMEQFDYSTSNNIIRNEEIENIQLELLKKIKENEEKVKRFWDEKYPSKLSKLKQYNKFANEKVVLSKKKIEMNGKVAKILKRNDKKSQNNFFKKLIRILSNSLRRVFSGKKENGIKNPKKNRKKKNNENYINNNVKKNQTNKESNKFDRFTDKKEDLLIDKDYDDLFNKWKNQISSFLEIELFHDSLILDETEEDYIQDLLNYNEFEMLEEQEGNVEFKRNFQYFFRNSVQFLKNNGIIDDFLCLNNDFLINIEKILKKDLKLQKDNLFLFLDLINCRVDNKEIVNFSYTKDQLIKFNYKPTD